MSVMLSHIDVPVQDDEDAELEREDEKQQEELRAFLEEEFGDDDGMFGDESFASNNNNNNTQSFTSHHHAKNQQILSPQKYNSNGFTNYNGDGNYNYSQPGDAASPEDDGVLETLQNKNYYVNHDVDFSVPQMVYNPPYSEQSITEYRYQTEQRMFPTNNFSSQPSHHDPRYSTQPSSQNPHWTDEQVSSNNNNSREDYRRNNITNGNNATTNNNNNNDHSLEDEVVNYQASQLKSLYNARGRKIEKLQKEMEEQGEQMAKENRLLQHKLTLCTGEKEGLKSSLEQLQSLLQEHKNELADVNEMLQSEHEKNSALQNQIAENEEKLLASGETIESLQLQIQQMNQSESLARSRAQHESMLATMRQKHEEQILTLKEKLDDMKQSLAWKTEDLNRYKEMMDSNSTASEVGMLRHRLQTEESNSRKLHAELEKKDHEIADLEEQLGIYETLLNTNQNQLSKTQQGQRLREKEQFSSTPFNQGDVGSMRRGLLNFKTPVSNMKATVNDTPTTTTPTSQNEQKTLRNELVNALSSNHKKRREIMSLRDEVNRLNNQLNESQERKLTSQKNGSAKDQSGTVCSECESYKALIIELKEGNQNTVEKLEGDLEKLNSENRELQTNMAELVKTFDRKKVRDIEAQNTAMLQLVDDAKEAVRNELQTAHASEIERLKEELTKINNELLHTKEEYVKLCDEGRVIETQIKSEAQNESQLQLEELRLQLEMEYNEKLKQTEDRLTNKHLDRLESEKEKWLKETEAELKHKIEQAVTLNELQLREQLGAKAKEECAVAVNLARIEWESSRQERGTHVEKELEEFKKEYCVQQKIIWEEKVKSLKALWEVDRDNEQKEKLKLAIEEAVNKEDRKWEEKLKVKESEHASNMSKLQQLLETHKQQLSNCELQMQLKDSTHSHQEEQLKRTIESLQADLTYLKSRLNEYEAVDSDVSNRSQTSIIFDKILGQKTENSAEKKNNNSMTETQWKQKEQEWMTRETELTTLLREASEKLRDILEKSDDSVFNHTLIEKLENASWISNNGIQSEKRTKTKKRISSLQSTKECKETERLQSELNSARLDVARLKGELESCRNQITLLLKGKEQVTNALSESENHVESLKKTVDELKLKHSADIEHVENAMRDYKRKAEQYVRDMEKEKNTLKEEHRNEVQTLTSQEKKKLDDLKARHQHELERLRNNILANISNQPYLPTTNSTIVHRTMADGQTSKITELASSRISKQGSRVLPSNPRSLPKETLGIGEEVTYLRGPENTTSSILNSLKAQHARDINKLKQNFRAKLVKISEMKKKWMEEEENRRQRIREGTRREFEEQIAELQRQHESLLANERREYESQLVNLQRQHESALRNQRQEYELKLENLQRQHDSRVNSERTNHEWALESLEKQHRTLVKKLNKENAQTVESLKEEHCVREMTMKSDYELLVKEKTVKEQELRLAQEKHEQLLRKLKTLEQSSDGQEGKVFGPGDDVPQGATASADTEFDASLEKMRQFYLESLRRIQKDVMLYIDHMRKKAKQEIKEAVRRERRDLLSKMRNENTGEPT